MDFTLSDHMDIIGQFSFFNSLQDIFPLFSVKDFGLFSLWLDDVNAQWLLRPGDCVLRHAP